MVKAVIQKQLDVELSVEDLAMAFCELDDDAQAKFFVESARIMSTWPTVARSVQPHLIGRHLRSCDCSTDEARELVADIYVGMTGCA